MEVGGVQSGTSIREVQCINRVLTQSPLSVYGMPRLLCFLLAFIRAPGMIGAAVEPAPKKMHTFSNYTGRNPAGRCVVFYHIAKSAGGTITSLLKRAGASSQRLNGNTGKEGWGGVKGPLVLPGK